MKKFRWICLVLCLILAMQWAALPCVATETEDPSESSEAGAETSESAQSGKTDPEGQDITLPTVSGDASISAGCRTIEGKVPLTNDPTLLKTAKAAFLYERNTGTILYAMNPDTRMYPASLTKVMTCMLVLENLTDMNEVITVSENAISGIDPDGSTANLQAGEEMTVENLLYCLMVASANDAGAVLAERVAGSEAAFVEMMNQRAKELGCVDTNFANAHGLHDDNHYTTARDLAKIMLAAVEMEEFRKLDSTSFYTVPATNMYESRDLYTTNFMIGDERIDQFYDKRVTGGKTGFTTPAGRCLMCTAQDENFSLLSIVLGAEEEVLEDGYTVTYYGNFEETEILLDYGFDNFQEVQVTMEGQTLGQYPVSSGRNDVIGGPMEEIRALLPVGYKQSDISWQCDVLGGKLTAPVEIGQTIGTCRVWYGSSCVAQTGMVSLSKSEERILGENIFSSSQLQKENLGKILKIAGIVFLGLVALLAVIATITAIRNAVIRSRRRRRRRERNATRRKDNRKGK